MDKNTVEMVSLEQIDDLTLPEQLGEVFFANLAERLEDVIHDTSRNSSESLSATLTQLLDQQYRAACEDARNAALGNVATAAAAQSYSLGQLSFAQLFAANYSSNRVPDSFETEISDSLKWLKVLVDGELTNTEISEQTRFKAEVVSRKLRTFRDAGVCDFRKEGRKVYNFLTPAAEAIVRQLATEHGNKISHGSPPSSIRNDALQKLKEEQQSHMTALQRFNSLNNESFAE